MFLLGIAVYFVLACCVIWLTLFPAAREGVLNFTSQVGERVTNRIGQWRLGVASSSDFCRGVVGNLWSSSKKSLHRYRWLIALAGLIVALPPILVWMFGGSKELDGFDDTRLHAQNEQVATLLQGERLVPPAPLPPAMFTTQEVLRIRPLLNDANRDWQLLDDDFSQRLLKVFQIMKDRYGYDMALLEGYRSPSRQDQLASMGSSITNAAAFQSYHQFGLAADCAFQRDGQLVISEKDPWAMRGYQLYGEVAESVGLNWGGRWKMMDFGHIELRKPNTVMH